MSHEETHFRRNTHPAAVAAAEVDAAVPDTHRHRLASLGKRPDQPIWTGLDSGGGGSGTEGDSQCST